MQVEASDAHEPLDHTAPAHEPQKVRSKTICWFSKNWLMSQPLNCACGSLQPVGTGAPLVMSDGMEPRGKNQTVTRVLVNSMA